MAPRCRLRLLRGSHGNHEHFWQRAMTRRQFVGVTVAGAGALAGATALSPLVVAAGGGDATPNPIGYGFQIPPSSIIFRASGLDPSSELGVITDVVGMVGAADVQGSGTATHPDGSTERLLFDSDMRFMQGRYVGADGRTHHGTFAFV